MKKTMMMMKRSGQMASQFGNVYRVKYSTDPNFIFFLTSNSRNNYFIFLSMKFISMKFEYLYIKNLSISLLIYSIYK